MNYDESQENIKSREYLPKQFCLQIFMCTLQEALDQLFILRKINKWSEISKLEDICEYKTIEERFSEKEFKVKREENVAHNFQENCATIEFMLKLLLDELKSSETYEQFTRIVHTLNKLKYDEKHLLEDTLKNEHQVENLRKCLDEERIAYFRQIETCMANIGKVKDEIEDFKTESDIKFKYIDAWENSKIEMNELLSSKKQEEKLEEIKLTNLEINKEIRVHEEIIYAYNEFERDLANILEEWKIKYAQDLAKINDKIRILKEQCDNEDGEIKKLQKLYIKREKAINDYKEYKKKQQEIRMETERKDQAATKIQAWWKGTMVRKGYGKFRKKKEKKAKKKSSEKKPVNQ